MRDENGQGQNRFSPSSRNNQGRRQASGRSGGEAILDEAAAREFAASLRGPVLLADDGDYDEARKLFNAMIDHRPAVIARCAGAADVVAAVRFAREHAWAFSR